MSDETSQDDADREAPAQGNGGPDRVVVVTPEGMGVAQPKEEERNPAELIESPAKVMRIGAMVKQLLEEVRSAPLDDAGRARLAHIHDTAVTELKEGLAPELDEELDRLVQPFKEGRPSDAELRIAQAQLVGWLEGLFHGIQTALVAQQMAAQAQLQEMRRALPAGPHGQGLSGMPDGIPGGPPPPDGPPGGRQDGTGQYL